MSSLYLNWHPLVDTVNIFHSDSIVFVRMEDLMSSFLMDDCRYNPWQEAI